MPLPVIGVVRTSHRDRASTPVQSSVNRAEHGTLEIAPEYQDGLDGLAGFDYAWLLAWLDRSGETGPAPLRQVPFLLRRRRREIGIFATRGPRRVNPIGLSLIQILAVTGGTVSFAGVVSPGLYQLNLTVPNPQPSGDNAISCTYNGSSTESGALLSVN